MEETILTEDHPVIEKLLFTDRIDDETRIIAVGALLALEESDQIWKDRARKAKDVDEVFEWEESDLGVDFWMDLQDEVFNYGKRSC